MIGARKLYFEKAKKDGTVEGDFRFLVRDEDENILIILNVFENSGDEILPKVESVFVYNTSSKDEKTDWIQVEHKYLNMKLVDELAERFVKEQRPAIEDALIEWALSCDTAI